MPAAPDRTPDGEAHFDARQALAASGHAFAITDAQGPDHPLIWVNAAFEQLTGYSAADAIGRDCRFLQGADTDVEATTRIREALIAGRPSTETLLNYRRDGTTWWNELTISPVLSAGSEVTHFVGVQRDVSDRVHADARSRAAQAAADLANDRLTLLAEASAALAATTDPRMAAQALSRLLATGVADWCSVLLCDSDPDQAGSTRVIAALAHRDHASDGFEGELLGTLTPDLARSSTCAEVMRTRRAVLIRALPDGGVGALIGVPVPRVAAHILGFDSGVIVPLVAGTTSIGAITLVNTSPQRALTQLDLEFAVDLGRRAADALEAARLRAGEHAAALALQRSLLPRLPAVRDLELAARYIPGSDRDEIGGDWYDVLTLPDGSTGIAIGDVMGHDMRAAGAMGQLRSVLRSYAWEGHGPAEVLDRLNQLVVALDMARLATCIYARIEPGRHGAPRLLRWANAGHPPPLLKTADGKIEVLDAAVSPLVGIKSRQAAMLGRPSADRPLPPGTTLVIYTDGLIESRALNLDDGIERLRAALGECDPHCSVDELVDRLVAAAGRSTVHDDQCILVVRITA